MCCGARSTAWLDALVPPRGVYTGWIWPTSQCPISQPFIPGQHLGIDIACPEGTPTVAARAGTVYLADWNDGYGLAVFIDHGDGYTTRYAHHGSLVVVQGQQVAQGQLLGYVDTTGNATGPHLHYEVRLQDTALDPAPFLDGAPTAPPYPPGTIPPDQGLPGQPPLSNPGSTTGPIAALITCGV